MITILNRRLPNDISEKIFKYLIENFVETKINCITHNIDFILEKLIKIKKEDNGIYDLFRLYNNDLQYIEGIILTINTIIKKYNRWNVNLNIKIKENLNKLLDIIISVLNKYQNHPHYMASNFIEYFKFNHLNNISNTTKLLIQ